MAKIVKGYWDCNYCGASGIDGLTRTCPNCGKSRDKDTRFYMKKGHVEYVKPVNNNKPDWICKYCEQLNPASTNTCISCGASRDEENLDYFENHIKKNGKQDFTISAEQVKNSRNGEKMYAIHEGNKTSKYEDLHDSKPASSMLQKEDTLDSKTTNHLNEKYSSIKTKSVELPTKNKKNKKNKKSKKHKNKFWTNPDFWKIFSLILVLLLAIGGLVYLLIPKVEDYTIAQTSWKYEIQIERYQTVDESDWFLPAGGRLKYTREEIHHYEQVLDHYDTEIVNVPHTIIKGYKDETTYSDNGNGTFTEHTESVPVYGTEYTKEKRSVPVYRDEPVYRTKYYYEIDKWLYERSVITSENDKTPYWGEVSLGSDERISNRITKYFADCINKKEETKTFSFSYDDWQVLEIGTVYKLRTNLFGSAEIVFDDKEETEQE